MNNKYIYKQDQNPKEMATVLPQEAMKMCEIIWLKTKLISATALTSVIPVRN
jgi:hypothetical protein